MALKCALYLIAATAIVVFGILVLILLLLFKKSIFWRKNIIKEGNVSQFDLENSFRDHARIEGRPTFHNTDILDSTASPTGNDVFIFDYVKRDQHDYDHLDRRDEVGLFRQLGVNDSSIDNRESVHSLLSIVPSVPKFLKQHLYSQSGTAFNGGYSRMNRMRQTNHDLNYSASTTISGSNNGDLQSSEGETLKKDGDSGKHCTIRNRDSISSILSKVIDVPKMFRRRSRLNSDLEMKDIESGLYEKTNHPIKTDNFHGVNGSRSSCSDIVDKNGNTDGQDVVSESGVTETKQSRLDVTCSTANKRDSIFSTLKKVRDVSNIFKRRSQLHGDSEFVTDIEFEVYEKTNHSSHADLLSNAEYECSCSKSILAESNDENDGNSTKVQITRKSSDIH